MDGYPIPALGDGVRYRRLGPAYGPHHWRLVMNKETALQTAQRAFDEAVKNSYPADLIARLYADLAQERRKAAARKPRR